MRSPWFYFGVKQIFRLLLPACFRFHCEGRHHIPLNGAAILCANHTSYMDPVLVGVALNRPCTYVARRTLFKGLAGRVFLALNGMPIDREGSGLDGIRSTLKELRKDELVLMFPEGTRSKDGNVQPIKRGIGLLARRAKVPVIPVGIDGAFDVLPKSGWLPQWRNIHMTIGAPIPASEFASLSEDEFIELLQARISECHAHSRAVNRGEGQS